jgi:hypothetical protein
MNKDQIKPIFPESPEAATFKTGLSGWVDRHGRFCGDDEKTARYFGSTHRKCDCGAVIEQRSYCKVCSRLKMTARHKEAEKISWDRETPLYSQIHDKYFFDEDELLDFMDECGIKNPDDLELFICNPNYLSQIDSDYWADDLPEDGDLPSDVEALLDTLNAAIRAAEPVSWSQSELAAIVEIKND